MMLRSSLSRARQSSNRGGTQSAAVQSASCHSHSSNSDHHSTTSTTIPKPPLSASTASSSLTLSLSSLPCNYSNRNSWNQSTRDVSSSSSTVRYFSSGVLPTTMMTSSLPTPRYQSSTSPNNSNNKKTSESMIGIGKHHNHQKQQVRTKVFVSSHADMNITSNQILDYCSNRGINVSQARVTSSHVILQECPFCSKPTNGKADNCYKCYVSIGGGAYFCHRCGNGGSWFDFKSHLRGYEHSVSSATSSSSASSYNGTASMYQGPPSYQPPQQPPRGGGGGGYGPQSSSSRGGGGGVGRTQPLPLPKQRLQAFYINNLMDSPPPNNDNESDKKEATADNNNNNNNSSSNNKKKSTTTKVVVDALDYLQNTRGLTLATLRKYGVGKGKYSFPSEEHNGQYIQTDCITFPWIMTWGDLKEQEALRGAEPTPISQYGNSSSSETTTTTTQMEDTDFITRRIKARALVQKSWQRLDPAGGGWGLFGFHTVPEDATEIVLTEGEYDAMAVWQATGRPAVSLPNGCRSLPMEVLPMLEKFKKIYLWMDHDGPGQEGAKQFAKKIGLNRCYIVQPPSSSHNQPDSDSCDIKDANEALLKGLDLEEMIQNATVIMHDNVMHFDAIRQDVIHEILHPDEYTGVPMPSLPGLTNIIKGYRRGELTILTGPTGSGKTTFLGQLSLDLAEQDVNVLWGSFEIKNTRLIQKLLQQYSRKPLPSGQQQDAKAILHQLADRFSALPMHFMKFHGGSDLEDVLDAMEYAVYVSDVEHIILDNLQFMISRNTLNKSFDKFDIQDIAIEKFRKFATDRNVHVTLVVHPRKEDEAAKLSISSIYGSAKATQEADTVMILQADNTAGRQRKYIEIKKNRFDGTLGFCPLHFDRLSGRYDDVPK